MKRIVLLASTDLNHDQRMARISASLHRAGAEVWLIGRTLPYSLELADQPYHQHRIRCFFHKGKGFYLEYNLRLFFFLLFKPLDYLVAADLDTLLPAFLVARLRRKKVYYDAHEYFTEVPELRHRPTIKAIWESVAGFAVPRVDGAYTVSNSLATVLTARYQQPFAVIRNMPYRSLTTPANPTFRPLLLYQGALNAGRGLEALLEAMCLLPEFTLWLAGKGDLETSLQAFTRTHGLTSRVHFLGNLSPEVLKALTPQAWLGFNLLDSQSPSYYYSLANKSVDYVQAGIPSIQMDFPEYRHLNNTYECFLLLDELTPIAIEQAVRSLALDSARYAHLCLQCQAAAEVWNWEQEEQKLLPLFFEND